MRPAILVHKIQVCCHESLLAEEQNPRSHSELKTGNVRGTEQKHDKEKNPALPVTKAEYHIPFPLSKEMGDDKSKMVFHYTTKNFHYASRPALLLKAF